MIISTALQIWKIVPTWGKGRVNRGEGRMSLGDREKGEKKIPRLFN